MVCLKFKRMWEARETVRKKKKKLQSHSKHNHNRSITPAKWFMSRFMPGSLCVTKTFSTTCMLFFREKNKTTTHETVEKTRVYSRYDLSFKLQNVRPHTHTHILTRTIHFFVWSLVTRIRTPPNNSSNICFIPYLFVVLEIFRSKWFTHLLSWYIYTYKNAIVLLAFQSKKPQKCLRPNKQENPPRNRNSKTNCTALFEVMSS